MGTVSGALDAISASPQVRQDVFSNVPADAIVEDVSVGDGVVVFRHRYSCDHVYTYAVPQIGSVQISGGWEKASTSDVLGTNLGTSVDDAQSAQISALMARYGVETRAEMTRRLLEVALSRLM